MDVAKKLMLAAIGAINLSKERLEELMDELVKKGEMTTTEKAEALKRMAEKIETSTEKLKSTVERQVEAVLSKLNILSRIDELAKKVDQLAASVEELKTQRSGKQDTSS